MYMFMQHVHIHELRSNVLLLCRDSLMLLEDLTNALVELEGEEGVPVVPVELVNPNVAKIFSKSPRAKVCTTHVYVYVRTCKLFTCICM